MPLIATIISSGCLNYSKKVDRDIPVEHLLFSALGFKMAIGNKARGLVEGGELTICTS